MTPSASKHAHGFVRDLVQDQPVWQRRMLADAWRCLLWTKSLVLADWGGAMVDMDGCGKMTSHQKRFCTNLQSDRIDLEALYYRLLDSMTELRENDGEGVLVPIDDTDAQHLGASRSNPAMEAICGVRDGSRSTPTKPVIGWGYPIHGAAAVVGGRTQLLALEPYDRREHHSELHAVEPFLARLRPHIGSKARWLFDRGYDSYKFYELLRELGIHNYIVRMQTGKTARNLEMSGDVLTNREALLKVADRWGFHHVIEDKKEYLRIGMREVHLTLERQPVENPIKLTLIVVWAPGIKGLGSRRSTNKPYLAFLCSQRLRGRDAAIKAFLDYTRRDSIEKVFAHVKAPAKKGGFRMEHTLVRSLRAQKVLHFLVAAAHTFLQKLETTCRTLYKTVLSVVHCDPRKPRYNYGYRLTKGYAKLLKRCRWFPRGWRSAPRQKDHSDGA